MSHWESRELLADLALGRLGQQERVAVEGHLAACRACRGWLEIYDLLSRAMEPPALEHPDAAELAEWAVLRPADLSPEAAGHLEACAGCRGELELLRAALAEARGGLPGRFEARRIPSRRSPLAAVWTAAAAVVFAVLLGSILLAPRHEPQREQVVASGTLSGEEVISAHTIHASDVEISDGSRVIFEAGDAVTLGEGFVVASGATFAAGDRTLPRY